ncbi:MAG: serine/threonine protein kinase, partial [Myxococcales bacterium]|nr:serine/threonine protein kinase [Myxococcales bacterium]
MPDRLIGGRYKVVRKLAEGGMGEVYEAQHNLSKKKVALKILFPHIGKDEAARQRFLREVSAPAQIGHEGIVEVYDAGFDTQDGSLFVAMEFIDGEPLRDRLSRGGVGLDQLLDWFEEMLDPLAAAHASGIVHRDLKPENVMLAKKRDSEVIKLLDFGIARDLDSSKDNVTHTGIAMGTPHYMAPEQAMSAKGVTAAADVWAMGVMLYEAL